LVSACEWSSALLSSSGGTSGRLYRAKNQNQNAAAGAQTATIRSQPM
jgi:hypothetical protein